MNIKEGAIVAKFGGSSMASARSINQVHEIVRSNLDRRFVVVSAPGVDKEGNERRKITDLLIERNMGEVRRRFTNLSDGLNLPGINDLLGEVEAGVDEGKSEDWVKSRGEWMMAKVFAGVLGGEFVDSGKLIKLKDNGQIDPLTYEIVKDRLAGDVRYVIPGFYGEKQDGNVLCFQRGGSDITGAIIAKGVGARVYENWTDVNGVKAADPRIVEGAKTIPRLTYKEMRELGYRGAEVLQMDAVLPVFESGIPIHLRSTFDPEGSGTFIVPNRESEVDEAVIGIAGKRGFVSFQIEKIGMNSEKGIARRVLEVFERNEVSFEHDPTGIDSMSVILHKDRLDGKTDRILAGLQQSINPDDLSVVSGIGLICLVGQGIGTSTTNIHLEIFQALKNAGIQVAGESYSIKGNNIIIAVDDKFLEKAIKAFYKALI